MNIREKIGKVGIISFIVYNTFSGFFGDNNYFKIILLLGIISGFYSLFAKIKKITLTQRILTTAFLLFTVFLSVYLSDYRIISCASIIFCCLSLNMRDILKTSISAKTICFCALLFLILLGNTVHLNSIALHIWTIVMLCTAYVSDYSSHKVNYLLLCLIYILSVIITRSGSLMVCGAVFIILFVIKEKNKESLLKKSKIIIPFFFPILLTLNLAGAIFIFPNRFSHINELVPEPVRPVLNTAAVWVDEMSSSRLQLASQSIISFGISPLGGNINYESVQGRSFFNLDSGFMWLIQGFGIIFTSIYFLIVFYATRNAQKNGVISFVVIMITIGLWAVNEDVLLNSSINIMFLYYSGLLYMRKDRVLSKKKA